MVAESVFLDKDTTNNVYTIKVTRSLWGIIPLSTDEIFFQDPNEIKRIRIPYAKICTSATWDIPEPQRDCDIDKVQYIKEIVLVC